MTNPNAPNFDYEDEQTAYLDYLDCMDALRAVHEQRHLPPLLADCEWIADNQPNYEED